MLQTRGDHDQHPHPAITHPGPGVDQVLIVMRILVSGTGELSPDQVNINYEYEEEILDWTRFQFDIIW